MPHWLAPWAIVRKKQPEMELVPSVIRWRNPGEKCEKRVNTRENWKLHASTPLWLQPAPHAQSIVRSGNFRCCSFSRLKVSQKCSQLIHMRFVPVLASGLETRNPFQNRQEKNEFYFLAAIKIFLTKKRNARVRGKIKNGFSSRFRSRRPITTDQEPPRRTVLADGILFGTPQLTAMVCMRNFAGSRGPRKIARRIKNAANPRGNHELAGELYRQFQPARGAPNCSIRPDRFFSFCAVRISD